MDRDTLYRNQYNIKSWKSIIAILLILTVLMVYLFSKTSRHMNDYGQKSIILKDGKEDYLFYYYVVRQMEEFNNARMSSAQDPITRDILKKSTDMFHIVTTFVPFDHDDLKEDLLIDKDRAPTDTELQARMAEVIECLQKNLNHHLVGFVHVLVLREVTVTFLRMLDLRNSEKLIIHKVLESPTMKHEIMYASKYLQKKLVIITHQDNYIGNGWQKVNHDIMKRTKLMYALTRHLPVSKCPAAKTAAHCGKDYPYMGSHDTFVFFVNEVIPDHQLAEIDVPPNMSGIENVLIWIFKNRFGYRVINPCKILIMYHNHCVSIREGGRERINIDKSGMAYFTDKLT